MGKHIEEKTYEQFMEEALLQIPFYTSDWTGYHLSDPGITTIENLSAFAVLQQNSMKQQTERMMEALYGLAGFERKTGSCAKVLLEASHVEEEYVLPAGQQFQVGALTFESENAVLLSKARLTHICLEDTAGKIYDLNEIMQKESKYPVSIFSEHPQKGMKLYLFFEDFPEENEEIIFYLKTAQEYVRNKKDESGAVPDFAKIQWKCYTRQGFVNIEVEDETDQFLYDGRITVSLKGIHPAVWKLGKTSGYVLCAWLEQAEYDIPPKVSGISGFLFEVTQKETKSFIRIFKNTEEISYYHDILEEEYFKLYRKKEAEEAWTLCEDGEYEVIHEGFGMYTFLFAKEQEEILLSAYTEEMMRTWHLGTIYGYDGERMKLPAENIAWQGCSVIAEKQIKKTGKICYYYLQPGKDKTTGFHFQIEEESGSLKILDAGNLYGCELYLGGICTFQGEQGNLPAGKEFQPKGYRTGIRFSNPAPGMGGRYMESMESLKARFLDDIYQVHAAVTAEDYEHIVKNVPGLCIDKVRAYRSPKKNAVCIAVKPAHPGMPKLSGKYKQMISQALEEKRMLNTVFELEQPVYLPVHVYGKIFVKDNYAKAGRQIEEVIRKELDYLHSEKNFGDVLKFDQIFSHVEALECVQSVGDFQIKPGNLSHASLEGADIRPADNCLIYPGEIKLDLNPGKFPGHMHT